MIELKLLILKSFVLFLFTSEGDSGPPCPRPCVCDYYASVHTIDCNSQDLIAFPNGIPEWTTSMNFDGNYLEVLDLNFFNITVYFEKLRIRYNEISSIVVNNKNVAENRLGLRGACNDIYKLFPRLTEVNLRGNKLKSLPKCLLSAWPVLKILNLNENALESLKDLNFADHIYYYDSLEELFLRRNKIKKVTQEDLFTPANGLRNAKIFDLGENQISHLDEGVFMFMPALRDVRLNDNQIRLIPDYAFVTSGQRIETIQLNQNRIELIGKFSFAGLPQLSRLDLRDNAIQCLNPSFLSTCVPFNLQSRVTNSTTEEQPDTLDESPQNSYRARLDLASLQQLRIKGNDWKCECWLKPLMQNRGIERVVYPSLDGLSCKSPEHFRNFYLPRAMISLVNCDM